MSKPKDAKVYCPVNGWDCPYWKKDGTCTIEDPMMECDDFSAFWDPDDEYWDSVSEDQSSLTYPGARQNAQKLGSHFVQNYYLTFQGGSVILCLQGEGNKQNGFAPHEKKIKKVLDKSERL